MDYFKFNATGGRQYRVETSNLGSGMDSYIYLYDTDGSTEIAHNDDGGVGLASRIVWCCASSGTYYVRVRHYSSSSGTGSYDISVNDEGDCGGTEDDYEPDDSASEAHWIDTNGQIQHHNFHVGGDVDWLKFNADSGTYFIKVRHYSSTGTGSYDIRVIRSGNTYTIETLNLDSDCDTYMYLYDTNATTEIAHNDDGGQGLASRIVWTDGEDGIIPLTLDVPHSDSLSGTHDFDMYSVEVQGGNTLEVNLDGPSSGADFDLYVRIGAQPTLTAYDARGYTTSADEHCEVTITSDSTVYIMVRSYSGSGAYEIIATSSVPQFVSLDTGFDPSLDGFNFSNDGTPIDESSPYSFLNVFGSGGICFGMSYSAARYYRILQANPNSELPHLFEACNSSGQLCPVLGIGEFWSTLGQNLWNSIWMELSPMTHAEFINVLIAYMEREGAPAVVALKKSGETGGHAILAYRIENTEEYVYIYVYNNWYVYNSESADYLWAGKNPEDDYIRLNKSTLTFDSYEGYDRFHLAQIPSWLW